MAAPNVYPFGQDVTVKVTFKDKSGDPVDPSGAITLVYQNPAGVATTWVYLTDSEVVRASQGNYTADIPTGIGGVWPYEWRGTGANNVRNAFHFVEADSALD